MDANNIPTCQRAEWWKHWTEEGKGFSPSLGLFWQNHKSVLLNQVGELAEYKSVNLLEK